MRNTLRDFLKERKVMLPLLALVFLFILRATFIGFMGLMPQDAYYYFYSEHPALSYYDHPPGIAALLWLFITLFGKKIFVVKLAASVVTFLSLIAFYSLARKFLDARGVTKAMAFLFSTFMITVLSLVATPDVPLILFWTLSLIVLYHAIFREKKIYWLWAGIIMGLAFDSKYTAVFLPAGMFLFLLLSKPHRKWLLSPWPYLGMGLFIATISPVIVWNWQHNFASFRFQGAGRVNEMGGVHISIKDFLGAAGLQAAVLVPVLFVGLVALLWKAAKQYRLRVYRIPEKPLFLLCFFVPVFAGFLFLSFFYWVKLNWMMPAYITGVIWGSLYLKEKWIRWQLAASLVIHVALAAEILFYPVVIKSDDTWVGWGALARNVIHLKQEYPGYFIFSADDYKTSAVLNFYLDEMVYSKNIIGERALQFDYVKSNLDSLAGKDALFIDSDAHLNNNNPTDYPLSLNRYFDRITLLETIMVKKYGRVVRKFFVYSCYNYHPEKAGNGYIGRQGD